MDLARRTLSSLQAAIAGQRIGRQDRRGKFHTSALRWDKNDPKDSQFFLHMLQIGVVQTFRKRWFPAQTTFKNCLKPIMS